jgi:hypothetical protein
MTVKATVFVTNQALRVLNGNWEADGWQLVTRTHA